MGTAGRLLEPIGQRRRMSVPVLAAAGSLLLVAVLLVVWLAMSGGKDEAKIPPGPDPAEKAAEAAWAEVAKLDRDDLDAEGAARLKAVLVELRTEHGQTAFWGAKAEDRGRLMAKAEAVLNSAKAGQADEKKLEEMLAYAREHWRQHPADYAEAAVKFRTVELAGKGTKWELAAADGAREVEKARDKAVDDEFKRLKDAGARLAEAGDYDGAIAALSKPAERIAAALKDRLEAERGGLVRQAEEKLGAALSAAEKLSKDGEPVQGLAELDKVQGIRYAAWADKLKALRVQLEKDKGNLAELERKRRRAEADKRLAAILDGFEQRMLAGRARDAASFLATERGKLGDLGPLMTAELGAAEKAAGELAANETARQKALEELAGRELSLLARNGATHRVTVKAVKTGSFDVEHWYTAADGERKKNQYTIKFEELAAGEVEKLLPPFKPETAEGEIALCLSATGSGRWAEADRALKAAGGEHCLAGRCRRLLEDRRAAAAEAEAASAWEELQKHAAAKPAGEETRRLLAAIDAFAAAHGATKLGAGKKPELDRLRASLGAADPPPANDLQRLFRGKVVRFEPRTNGIELLWDFSDPRQIEDFSVAFGKWKIEKEALVGEISDTWERRPIRLKAIFSGDAPCRLSCSATVVRDCDHLSVYLGEPAGREAYLQWRRTDKIAGLFVHDETRQGALTRVVAPDLAVGKAGQFEMTVSGGKVLGSIDGRYEAPAQDFRPARIQPALHAVMPKYTGQVSYDNLRIVGVLDRQWLEAEMKKPAAR